MNTIMAVRGRQVHALHGVQRNGRVDGKARQAGSDHVTQITASLVQSVHVAFMENILSNESGLRTSVIKDGLYMHEYRRQINLVLYDLILTCGCKTGRCPVCRL
ncbi:MAG: hypothetical protein ACYCZA_11460 [Thiobacillus sp.]